MKRSLILAVCAVIALSVMPGEAALVTTVKGSSQFDVDPHDPLVYKRLSVSFSDARAQTAADYPPVGLGSATVTLTPWSGAQSSATINLYNMSVRTLANGNKEITFAGISSNNRCYTGLITSGAASASVSMSSGELPCVENTLSLTGKGTTSFTYSQTG
jgi:hypothetical protein